MEAATLTRAPSLPVRRIRTRQPSERRAPRPARRAGLRRRADLAIVAEYILELSERHGPATSREPG